MAVLHVRDVPDRLYRRIQRMAESQGRSLSAQVIALLEEAERQEEARRRQAAALEAIFQGAWAPPPGSPDSVELVHAVRDERAAQLEGQGA
jgi:plasmid stability protein